MSGKKLCKDYESLETHWDSYMFRMKRQNLIPLKNDENMIKMHYHDDWGGGEILRSSNQCNILTH